VPLTDATIRSAKSGNRAFRLFDGGGLYLEVNPRGGKWWRWKYRFGGTERRLSLGVYPAVGLKSARAKRDALRQQLAAGVDPGQARKAAKVALAGAESFEAIAREWHAKLPLVGSAATPTASRGGSSETCFLGSVRVRSRRSRLPSC
jgi:hypothetical protein